MRIKAYGRRLADHSIELRLQHARTYTNAHCSTAASGLRRRHSLSLSTSTLPLVSDAGTLVFVLAGDIVCGDWQCIGHQLPPGGAQTDSPRPPMFSSEEKAQSTQLPLEQKVRSLAITPIVRPCAINHTRCFILCISYDK